MMNIPEYPVFLTEVNCHPVHSFCFTLPPQNVGWNNVTLYIEYEAAETSGTTIYHVWAQFHSAVFRAHLCVGQVSGDPDDADVIRQIISHINDCENFHEQIRKFVNCIAEECG